MSKDIRLEGEVLSIQRLNNSVNGNPRYRFVVDGAFGPQTLTLQSDAACGYEVGNPGYRVGSTVCFHLTDRGYVKYMETMSTI